MKSQVSDVKTGTVVYLIKALGISVRVGEARKVERVRDGHLFYGCPVVYLEDNQYTSTVVPRDAVCTVPAGHIGFPCIACGLGAV